MSVVTSVPALPLKAVFGKADCADQVSAVCEVGAMLSSCLSIV